MKYLKFFILLLAAGQLSAQTLPSYYDAYIAAKKAEVSAVSSEQSDGFIFLSDTHIKPGASIVNYTPELINAIMDGVAAPKVIWGGDAVPAYTDQVEKSWELHKQMFDRITTGTDVLLTHGNHDLTARISKDVKEGYSLSKSATAKRFKAVTSEKAVYNPADKNTLYFYYDQPYSKVRYIILDVFDEFKGTDVYWGVKEGFSDKQYEWVFREAVMNAPKDYGLFFVMHWTTTFDKAVHYKKLNETLHAFARHQDYGEFEFSKREDLKLLMALGGHRHHDMQVASNGLWSVITVCDACYTDDTRSPFSEFYKEQRKKETTQQHGFDYVSINKDFSKVSMIRFGIGRNRVFNINPVSVTLGSEISLTSEDSVKWICYDSDAIKYVNRKRWSLPSSVVGVTPDGRVFGLKEGEAVVAAIDSKGNQEYFYVKVTK